MRLDYGRQRKRDRDRAREQRKQEQQMVVGVFRPFRKIRW
jgi:hypothetical protein